MFAIDKNLIQYLYVKYLQVTKVVKNVTDISGF